MSRGRGTRTQTCGRAEAGTRSVSAEKFLEVARLIGLNDKAQYGIIYVSRNDLKVAMRQAERLVDFAKEVIRR